MTPHRMQLLSSPRSPFARKVRIALYETGLMDQVDVLDRVVALHAVPGSDVLAVNPLGKLPALVTSDGQHLYDSRVICAFLDHLAPGYLFPTDARRRIQHLRLEALADGITDILLLWRTELTRPAQGSSAVRASWSFKIKAAMTEMDRVAPELERTEFSIAHIAVMCALGQLDVRWPDCAWRDHFPSLRVLEATLSARPSISGTRVPDQMLAEGRDVTRGQLNFSA